MLWSFPFTSSAVRCSNFIKIFQKCRGHLKILDAARLTQCKVHTDEPQTLGNNSTKLFATGFWHPEFGHPCITDWLPHSTTLYSTTWKATLKEILSAYILLVLPSIILCACLVSLCYPDRVPSIFFVHVLSLSDESLALQLNIVKYLHYSSPYVWPVGCTGICVGRTNHIPMEYETKDRLRAAA
jgi:hypothetical protein